MLKRDEMALEWAGNAAAKTAAAHNCSGIEGGGDSVSFRGLLTRKHFLGGAFAVAAAGGLHANENVQDWTPSDRWRGFNLLGMFCKTKMANGDKLQLADVSVEAVPAYNSTVGREQFHPKGRDNGYILTIDGLRIYIAGDTEDIPEMAQIKDIDIAFLPCNQPYTMTPDQLVRAAKVIKPKVLFPYHYGQTDLSSIPAQLEGTGIDVRIRHYE